MMNSLLLSLCVFSFCTLGGSQNTNLTLFKIVPCSGVVLETVSRFKSDIYAVEPDLSNCSNVSVFQDDIKIVSKYRGLTVCC